MTKMRGLESVRPDLGGRIRLVALALGLGLSACGQTLATLPVVGEPTGAPPSPALRPAFPNVADSPAGPSEKPLTAEERAKVEAELATARTQAAIEKRKQINQTGSR